MCSLNKNDLTRPLSLSFTASFIHFSPSIKNNLNDFVFLSGLILKIPIWGDPADDNCYDDEVYWEVRMPFHRKVELFPLKERSRPKLPRVF